MYQRNFEGDAQTHYLNSVSKAKKDKQKECGHPGRISAIF